MLRAHANHPGGRAVSHCAEVVAEVQVAIRRELERLRDGGLEVRRLLDVGCWDGSTTLAYAGVFGCAASGIEVFEAEAAKAAARGVDVARLDLETRPFPWSDASMDVVVINQVLEHLKNVWLPMTELHRVLRPGGAAILSVPNLASLHNRVLMAFGRQPTSIRTFGPHVRGYTFHEFRAFVARGGAFEVERARSVGFYPLPARFTALPTALWRGAGHTTLVVARKRGVAPPWLPFIRGELDAGLQTYFEP
jgi:methionine biosynthesis protein MetW